MAKELKCCKGCEDRHEACHSSCITYEKWKAEIKAIKDEKAQAKRAQRDMDRVAIRGSRVRGGTRW